MRPSKLTLQQRGINALEPDAFDTYARVIVETAPIATAERLELIAAMDSTPHAELAAYHEDLLRESLRSSNIRLLSFVDFSWAKRKGYRCRRMVYRRSLDGGPATRVENYWYILPKMVVTVMISYWEQDADMWRSTLERLERSIVLD
ncbi:MAG: hypothetical protein CSA07_03620 [Bacteroidia bacterium]|nr:MAG: hypothetical protein CSA07_03620 [Bacteroidia bacterium]